MLKYPCLVLDHDDTVVQSEATVNYPYFCEILDYLRPGEKITLQEYTLGCYSSNFVTMCRQKYGFTDEELQIEYNGWKQYIQKHIPAPFPGIRQLIHQQKAKGGKIFVVSHSTKDTITRDYHEHFQIVPDGIFGWDYPEHQRKPNPYPLLEIMQKYGYTPDQVLVVDDMKPAWEMARAAGVRIAFAGWGRIHSPKIVNEMTELCDYHFLNVSDLTDFLFK